MNKFSIQAVKINNNNDNANVCIRFFMRLTVQIKMFYQLNPKQKNRFHRKQHKENPVSIIILTGDATIIHI